MGSVTSTLTMRMVDGVSAPAAKARGALNSLNSSASRLAAQSGRGGALGSRGAGATFLASGGSMLVGAAATYMSASAASSAVRDYANWDRRLTRIRQTVGSTRQEMKAAEMGIRGIAKETGLTVDDVTEGVEALVAAGRSLPETLAFLPSVARTAQASGSSVADIAKTADSIGASMKIASGGMSEAFDILVAAGKAGKFELRDMAGELPSLAAAAGAAGMKGTDGLRRLAAMLQIIRNQTGTAGEAATNLSNLFQKMETAETISKFKKFGIDLPKAMAAARREGRDLVEVFLDLTQQAVKGDLSKLPQLIGDLQFLQGTRALLSQRDALRALIAALRDVKGAVDRDVKAPAADARSALNRMSDAWRTAVRSFAETADAAGATSLLEMLSAKADETTEEFRQLARVIQLLRDGKYLDAGSAAARILAGPDTPPPSIAELDDVARRQASGRLPPEIQNAEELRAARNALRGLKRDKAMDLHLAVLEAELLKAERLTNALVSDMLPRLPDGRGLEGVPPEYRAGRYQTGGIMDRVSGATRARPRSNLAPLVPMPPTQGLDIAPPPDPLANLPGQVRASGEAAVREAELVAARIKQALDINPVIRPRVDMPSLNYGLGQRVSDGVNGGLSDNGARR